MTGTCQITERAADELRAILRHAAAEYGPHVAAKQNAAFDRAFERIGRFPQIGREAPAPVREQTGQAYRIVSSIKPFAIYYTADAPVPIVRRILPTRADYLHALDAED